MAIGDRLHIKLEDGGEFICACIASIAPGLDTIISWGAGNHKVERVVWELGSIIVGSDGLPYRDATVVVYVSPIP